MAAVRDRRRCPSRTRPPAPRRPPARAPVVSSRHRRAHPVHALRGLRRAGVDKAAYARARAGRDRLPRRERAAVTTGAVVGLEAAVAVARARTAARWWDAQLLVAGAVRFRADAAAVVAADHPRRAAGRAAR